MTIRVLHELSLSAKLQRPPRIYRYLNMRKLKEYPAADSAQRLSDFLEVEGIENQLRPRGAGQGVWVLRDDDLLKSRQLLAQFEAGFGNQVGAVKASALDSLEEPSVAEHNQIPSRFKLREKAQAKRKERQVARRPVYTPQLSGARRTDESMGVGVILLMIGCVLVAVLSNVGKKWMPSLWIVPVDMVTLRIGFFDPLEPWRLVTPIFIHFGFFHLIFNGLWLKRLGAQVESHHGTVRFLLLVVFSAIAGNWAQFKVNGSPLFGGMSGVNYGLFGFVWMQSRYGSQRLYSLSPADVWMLMIWLVLCGIGLVGHVANATHALGLVAGLAAGLPAYFRFRTTYRHAAQPEKGSWADQNLKGWKRFEKLYFEPYAPGWFLLIALVILGISYA